jgi:hypothetical protein
MFKKKSFFWLLLSLFGCAEAFYGKLSKTNLKKLEKYKLAPVEQKSLAWANFYQRSHLLVGNE